MTRIFDCDPYSVDNVDKKTSTFDFRLRYSLSRGTLVRRIVFDLQFFYDDANSKKLAFSYLHVL